MHDICPLFTFDASQTESSPRFHVLFISVSPKSATLAREGAERRERWTGEQGARGARRAVEIQLSLSGLGSWLQTKKSDTYASWEARRAARTIVVRLRKVVGKECFLRVHSLCCRFFCIEEGRSTEVCTRICYLRISFSYLGASWTNWGPSKIDVRAIRERLLDIYFNLPYFLFVDTSMQHSNYKNKVRKQHYKNKVRKQPRVSYKS